MNFDFRIVRTERNLLRQLRLAAIGQHLVDHYRGWSGELGLIERDPNQTSVAGKPDFAF